jgi:hypothetical protein
MQDYSTDTKVTILLNALDFQLNEIQRRQDREQQIFQWATSLLLAVFGSIIALRSNTAALPSPFVVKTLASVMIVLPILFSVQWIFRLSSQATNNAGAVERLQNLLHLFDPEYYGSQSPYPQVWEGRLKLNLRERKTPVYYAAVMIIMTICVVLTLWLIL